MAKEFQWSVIDRWPTHPGFIKAMTKMVKEGLEQFAEEDREDVLLLFSAHSLPQRIIDAGDPYPDELRSTAEAVAGELGLVEGDDWQIAWQSAGRTPEPWIGPDILEVIDALGGPAQDVSGVIVSACGFVADHLEVLYDLDIEAAQRAQANGLAFDRTACVNDHPTIMAALADRVIAAVAAGS